MNPPRWPAMGPNPRNYSRDPGYIPWSTEIPTFRCPSDPGVGLPSLGRTNYAMCMGDAPNQWHNNHLTGGLQPGGSGAVQNFNSVARGFFMTRKKAKFRDILDGQSNTIAMAEILTDLGDGDKRSAASWERRSGQFVSDNPSLCSDAGQIDPERPQFWCRAGSGTTCTPPTQLSANNHEARGANWANFRAMVTQVFTVLPPNSENCVGIWIDAAGTMPAASRHQGGAHVLMGDGAVVFMSDSVEAGDRNAGGVRNGQTGTRAPGSKSPYGLWGALGTKASAETIQEQLNQ
ncbi:MAG: DUF1559 domain-containing protein [Pirellulaceae bacterium]